MIDQILHHSMCNKILLKEFGIYSIDIKDVNVIIKSKTNGNEDKSWNLFIDCIRA